MYDGVGWYLGAGDRAWPLLGNCGMGLGNCGGACRAVGWPGKLFDGPGELWAVTLASSCGVRLRVSQELLLHVQ